MLALAGCLPLAGREARPQVASSGCIEHVVTTKLPAGVADAEAHCLAAGLIARYCSPGEAWTATVAKELRDLFGPGDADAGDIRAGNAGVRCARNSDDDEALRRCCASARAQPASRRK
jgi:hypothetical protein